MTPEPALDDRDVAALLFTWQSRFVTLAQLRRAFWAGRPVTAAGRRLRVLREAGLLGFRRFAWLSERLLYFPSRAGNRILADCGLLAQNQVRDCPPTPEHLGPALRHDLQVVDLRLGLEESGADGGTWISDHELRIRQRAYGRQERVPDGLFDFEFKGRHGRGVLEYERVIYHRSKIPALLARLRDRHEGRVVFVACAKPGRAETFRTWAEACGVYQDAPGRIAFSHHAAVAKHGLDGGFVDLEGQAFRF